MKRFIALLGLFTLSGCYHRDMINSAPIKMIKVVRYRTPTDSITVTYADAARIKHIIKAVNDNTREPLFFDRDCTMHLIYKDSTAVIICGGSFIKYKGNTYRMNNSMEAILN